MTDEEIDMEEVSAADLARAMEVKPRTLQHWLKTGELEGRQTFTGRWFVKIGHARAFIKSRARDGGQTETRFNAFVNERFRKENATC